MPESDDAIGPIEYFNRYKCMDFNDEENMESKMGLTYGCSNMNNVECPILNSIIDTSSGSNVGVFCCTDNPIPGEGCVQQSEEIKLIENKVYACNGVRYSGISEFPGNIRDIMGLTKDMEIVVLDDMICGSGYHICKHDIELDFLGLNRDQCSDNRFGDKFYGTLAVCGVNGICGCSTDSNDPNNGFNVLNSVLNEESLFKTNGLLCCVNDRYPKSKGCVRKYQETVVIKDTIYACVEPIFKTEYLGLESEKNDLLYTNALACHDGYHICRNAYEAEFLGLKESQCMNIADNYNGLFYATLEGRKSDKCGTDVIYGCSSNGDTSNICGMLNSMIDGTSLYAADGVLCCVDSTPGIGCENKDVETTIIKDKLYACGGEYNDIEDAEKWGCAAYYHVCTSDEELNSAIDRTLLSADGLLCCADEGEWKDIDWEDMSYMASLRFPSGNHGCGGSILTLNGHNRNSAILTAAHCIIPEKSFPSYIYIGCTTSACNDPQDSMFKQKYLIESIKVHPDYDDDNQNNNDIAIIYLTQNISNPKAIPVVIESD
eukprot:303752_1